MNGKQHFKRYRTFLALFIALLVAPRATLAQVALNTFSINSEGMRASFSGATGRATLILERISPEAEERLGSTGQTALYRGVLRQHAHTTLATASRHADEITIQFGVSRYDRMYEVSIRLLPRPVITRVARVPHTFLALCAARSTNNAVRSARLGALAISGAPRVLEVGIDTDYEFYTRFGSNSQSVLARIQTVMNAAEGIYLAQLGIQFKAISQHLTVRRSQPYTRSDAEALLYQFRAHTNSRRQLGSADLYHLMSGKNLQAGVLGVAFVGEVCRPGSSYRYSLSQGANGALHYLVMAHEIGHGLGANHPEEVLSIVPPTSLMTLFVEPSHTRFSSFSIGEIESHLNRYGSCLGDGPVPQKLRVRRLSSTRFEFSLLGQEVQTAGLSCALSLYGAPSSRQLSGTYAAAVLVKRRSWPVTRFTLPTPKSSSAAANSTRAALFRAVVRCVGGAHSESSITSKTIKLAGRDAQLAVRTWLGRVKRLN